MQDRVITWKERFEMLSYSIDPGHNLIDVGPKVIYQHRAHGVLVSSEPEGLRTIDVLLEEYIDPEYTYVSRLVRDDMVWYLQYKEICNKY